MAKEKNVYEEYAVLDAQIRALTAQKDELKVQVLEEIIENNIEKIETSVGTFSVAKLKTWTYTDKVIELEEKFKAQKASEQSTGDATFEEKPSLRFSKLKL